MAVQYHSWMIGWSCSDSCRMPRNPVVRPNCRYHTIPIQVCGSASRILERTSVAFKTPPPPFVLFCFFFQSRLFFRNHRNSKTVIGTGQRIHKVFNRKRRATDRHQLEAARRHSDGCLKKDDWSATCERKFRDGGSSADSCSKRLLFRLLPLVKTSSILFGYFWFGRGNCVFIIAR